MHPTKALILTFAAIVAAASGCKANLTGGSVSTTGAGTDAAPLPAAPEPVVASDTSTTTETSTSTATQPTDDQPPATAVLSQLPQAATNAVALNVIVGGARVATYASMILDGTNDCSGYTPTVFVATSVPITTPIGLEGTHTLCVVGKSAAGVESLLPAHYTFAVDRTAPQISLATSGARGFGDVDGGVFSLTGSASDASAGLHIVQLSVKDTTQNKCLNDAKTAFDQTCPHYAAAVGTSTFSFGIAPARLVDATTYDVTAIAYDKAVNTAEATTSFTWSTVLKLYVGVQDDGPGAFVQVFDFNPTTSSLTISGSVDLSGQIGAGALRGFADRPDGSFIVGDGGSRNTAVFSAGDTVSTAGPAFTTGGSPAELGNIHGVCALPDGTYIAGSYTGGAAPIYQFAANGSYLRQVYTTTIGSLTDCVAANSTEVYLIDYDSNSDSDGDLVKLTLAGGAWSVAGHWDQSAAAGVAAGSSIYSLVLHSDGNLYALPQDPVGGRNLKMIRCIGRDLSQCAPYGSDLFATTTDFAQGLVQIPYSDDLLLLTNTEIRRVNAATGASQRIYDLTTVPPLSHTYQFRHLRLR